MTPNPTASAVVLRLLCGALLAMGVLRGGLYLAAAALTLPSPDQTHWLEGASVHFAWRAREQMELYPDGGQGPYTTNLMGPLYFWFVGGLGRLIRADATEVASLYFVGRAVTFLSLVGYAAVAACWIGRRFGPLAGWAAAVVALGSAPAYGFGVMTRPDAFAEFLGLAGFVLAVDGRRRGAAVATVLFAAAMLTKQTAGVYLVAAVLAAAADRQFRRAVMLTLGSTALAAAVVATAWLLGERRIAGGLFGQAAIPWSIEQWVETVWILARLSPEVLALAALASVAAAAGWFSAGEQRRHAGGGRFAVDGQRAVRWLVVVLLAAALTTVAKRGSDLNYFLSWRVLEMLAMAGLACRLRGERGRWPAVAAALAAVALVWGTASTAALLSSAVAEHRLRSSVAGRERDIYWQRLVRLAADPAVPLLTDSDRLAVHQGARAAFLDLYLFRLEVENGRADPGWLRRRIESREYRLVVLTLPLDRPRTATSLWRWPVPLESALKEHYQPLGKWGDWYVYGPR